MNKTKGGGMMTKRTLGSAGGLLTVFLTTCNSANLCAAPGKLGSFSEGGGDFYVGLSYSPAFSMISGFDIRESTGETAAVYPYLKDGKRVEWKATNFDWNTPDPRIRFKDNALVALEASIGYSIGAARVELEIGYEQFKTRGIRDTGTREEEADTVYLLAKALPHTLVSDQNDEFKKLLAETEAKDIVAFAQAVGNSAPKISENVCANKKVKYDDAKFKHHCRGNKKEEDAGPRNMREFGEAVSRNPESWPSGYAWDKDASKADGNGGTNSNAAAYGLIHNLGKEDKKVAAGLLTRTISGGEVVEIRAVSTTSVMLNSCYDLRSEDFAVVPFACLGVGVNFVNIVDGAITPKLAYKVKAGLSYTLSPDITVFASGFYHRILGEGDYDDLPTRKLVDDITTNKTKEFARASFKLAYTGAEFGIRLMF